MTRPFLPLILGFLLVSTMCSCRVTAHAPSFDVALNLDPVPGHRQGGRLTLPCQQALPTSSAILMTADGATPAVPFPTVPAVAFITTAVSGWMKLNYSTMPVSRSLGPSSGSTNATSKMPPMYFLTSSAFLSLTVPTR